LVFRERERKKYPWGAFETLRRRRRRRDDEKGGLINVFKITHQCYHCSGLSQHLLFSNHSIDRF
jgi:hypothetical protein